MSETVTRKRIDYFDLMKGVCIVLVVISHCCEEYDIIMGNEHIWSMLEHLRMPLYFFLSGLFFKQYSGFIDFVVRKFNKLIIPFLFFVVITVVPKLLSGEIPCELLFVKKHFAWMIKYSGYLWFLRALFFANILYYVYDKLVEGKNIYVRTVTLLAVTAVGWGVNSFIPVEGDFRSDYAYLSSLITAFLVMPFFFVTSNLRPLLLQLDGVKYWKLLVLFAVSLALCYATASGGVYLANAKVQNNVMLFYVASFSAIACVWCVCYAVKRLFYFSYVGRYSIIVYLTHCPLLSFLAYLNLLPNVYWLAAVILATMPLAIWFFKKFFPAFVAQRDILIYENGKISIDWSAIFLKNRTGGVVNKEN